MSKQAIVERIISDAEADAAEIIAAAKQRAKEISDDAQKRVERDKQGTKAEIAEKAKAISDGKAASARLDSAKILLREKRRVIDGVYSLALKKLCELGKAETLKLAEKLLTEFAEDGDEIVFANGFAFREQVAALHVVKEKKLKVSPKTADIDGGFILRGKYSDKNVSYGALLAQDREAYQAEIAAKLF